VSWEGIGSVVVATLAILAFVIIFLRRRFTHKRSRHWRVVWYVELERRRDDTDDTSLNGHSTPASSDDKDLP
jgi:hypothetical protein